MEPDKTSEDPKDRARDGNVSRTSALRDFLLLALANAIWGATDVAAKFAGRELSPEVMAWARFTVAMLFFFPILVMRRSEVPRTVKGWLPFVALGATGFFLDFVLDYHGLKYAPASHATTLRVSEALIIVVLSAVFLRERVGPRAILGFGLGLIGVFLVMDVDWKNLRLFASGYRRGDLLIIAGTAVEALYTVIGKPVLVKTRPLTATALACGCGWLMLTLTSLPGLGQMVRHPPSFTTWLAVFYLGLIATVFAFVIWFRVLARQDSHRVGMTIMIQPVVGIPLAALVFHDPMRGGFLLGAGLIAAGVYLTLMRRTKKS